MHLGHQRVIEAALATGLPVRVLTFHPHPRVVLGNFVESIATLERRLELLAELGVAETTVLDFTARGRAAGAGGRSRARSSPTRPSSSRARTSASAGSEPATSSCSSGSATRCGRCRCSKASRRPRSGAGCTQARSRRRRSCSAGRPELDGVVVPGDQRGGTLGYPTANLAVDPTLLVPRYGIYAGASLEHRAAISIGTNPHYGGEERRIEPYLLDFEGDLYGRRLLVELWERLRDEQVFESEQELIDQIARDVEATRGAVRPRVQAA